MSTAWAIHVCIYANRMSAALFLPPVVKFSRFRIMGKSKKRILDPRISPLGAAKLVQGERKSKFICIFPPTRYESVGCDDCWFISTKECDLLLTS